jgi:hypothetical protein
VEHDLLLENSLLKTRLQELTMEVNLLEAENASLKQQVTNLSVQFNQHDDEGKLSDTVKKLKQSHVHKENVLLSQDLTKIIEKIVTSGHLVVADRMLFPTL